MNLTTWLSAHRRSVVFIVGLLTLAGTLAALKSPVALFPHVDFPRIVVSVDAGDRPADRMAIEVTRLVEEELRGIPGVRGVRSATSRGTAEVSVTFDWGQDMVSALLLAESAVNRLAPMLPMGSRFDVRRMDPTVFPVVGYSLTSDIRSGTELRELAEFDLRPLVATVEGVSRADVLGGSQRELRVTVEPQRLESFGLTVDDVATTLRRSNVIAAVGRMEDLHHLYLVIGESQTLTAEALGGVVLRSSDQGTITLDDVATVAEAAEPQWTRVVADGQDAVLLQVYQQPGSNTVAIAQGVAQALETRQRTLPSDIRVATWYDQSELIVASEASVRDAILVGVALACFVIFIFLRSVRITLTALIVVPSVLATTALVLYLIGQSLNIMTLGGMAAAVGLIIDDVIVVIEHLSARKKGVTPLESAAELTRPLLISSSVTVIVFAPLAFLSGVTGAFFAALAVTMASALVISFLMAWLFVPLLAERLLGDVAEEPETATKSRMGGAYRRVLTLVVTRPAFALIGVLPLVGVGYIAYGAVASEFMPVTDEGGFILDYRAGPGSSLTETDRLCRQIETILGEVPDIDTYSRRTGLQLGGGLTEANQGDYFIRLHSGPRRPLDEVMSEVRSRVQNEVPGLEIEMAQLMEDLIGDLTAVPQPIEIIIYADDEASLRASSTSVAEAIGAIHGVVDVNDGMVPAGDALRVDVDEVRAVIEGLSPEEVTQQVAGVLDGSIATYVQRDPQMLAVRVWVPFDQRRRIADVEQLRLRAPDGHVFPLARVATVTRESGQPQIAHDDLRRMVAVTARIDGRDMGSVMKDVELALARPEVLGDTHPHRLGGLFAEQQKAFTGLLAVFGAAIALVFMVLLFAFERFRVAIAMLIITLLAMCAVLAGLWWTNTPLNISSMMGMTMVVGIVTEVAVFYVAETARPADVPLTEVLVEAGVHRARPILMTSIAAILALTPLALAIGEGSSMQQPLAIAIISGLIVQVPLVLLLLPAVMKLLRARPAPSPAPGQSLTSTATVTHEY